MPVLAVLGKYKLSPLDIELMPLVGISFKLTLYSIGYFKITTSFSIIRQH